MPRIGDGISLSGVPHHLPIGTKHHHIVENVVFYQVHIGVGAFQESVVLDSAFIGGPGCGIALECGESLVMKGNAIADTKLGLYSEGYCMHQDDFANVTVHDVDLGWHLKGRLESDPTARRGMLGHGLVMWSIYDIGLWIFGESPRRAIFQGWLIANAVIRILSSNVGPDPKSHTLSLKRSSYGTRCSSAGVN